MADASLRKKNRWENEINISPVEACVSFNQEGRHTPMYGEFFGEMRSTKKSWGKRQIKKESPIERKKYYGKYDKLVHVS